MDANITYQVGSLLLPGDGDPELKDEREAMKLAIAESLQNKNSLYGVWTGQMHGSELLFIAYDGEIFRKS